VHAWWLIPLVLCAVALTVALVAAVLALRRALQRLELVLAVLERQLGPTLEEVRGLTQEAHAVTHDARTGVARLSATIDRVNHLTESLGSFLVGVSGFTRAGQLIGVALGVRKGIDVFVERLRRPHGRKHHG
jgi:uncharacterized protein YoxC